MQIILNNNLEELKNKEFEVLKNKIIDLKSYIEKLINTPLPLNIKKELNLLYEDLVMFDFDNSISGIKENKKIILDKSYKELKTKRKKNGAFVSGADELIKRIENEL